MTAPHAATIANEIGAEVTALLLQRGHVMSENDPDWTRLIDSCERLQQVSVVEASALKSDLYFIAGNIDRAVYFAENIIKNGDRIHGTVQLLSVYTNAGYVSRGSALLGTVLDVKDGAIVKNVPLALSSASFAEIADAAHEWIRAGGTIERKDLLMKAEHARTALNALGVPQARLQAMMDEAGAILRAKNLLWLNDCVDVGTSPPGASPFVAMSYRVAVSPSQAADMTWELAETLAAKDLVVAGVSVAFIGQAKVATR